MIDFRLSAHSLDKHTCPWRGYMYRILGRRPVEISMARIQGTAGHAAVAAWRQGKSVAEQEAEIDRCFQGVEIPPDDHRTPSYLKEVIAQYRAQYCTEGMVWEEIERPFEIELGVITTRRLGRVRVLWTGRRDAVGYSPIMGQRFVFDDKFMSRDEGADQSAARNSCALKGYSWSYSKETGRKVDGAILRRTIVRRQTKEKPLNMGLPLDPPILFPSERIAEWERNTLLRAGEIIERDPEVVEDWPMCESLCRHTYGCCDYLDVCCLPPGLDRLRKLQSPAFEDCPSTSD